MNTPASAKFNLIVKHGFHEILKPLAFKKKANNFYRQLPELGQIVNLQKSEFYSKSQIHFTINIGIFVPEYWYGWYCQPGKTLPDYPTEPLCLIRERIGGLRNGFDTWYDVTETTDETALIATMKENVEQYILPHFARLQSTEDCLLFLEQNEPRLAPVGKLILYGELKMQDKAKAEYQRILSARTTPAAFAGTLQEYAEKYNLVSNNTSAT